MDIILLEEIPSLGSIGDQVVVREGYARNFLIPRKLAMIASVKNRRRLEHEKRMVQARVSKAKANASALADRLGAASITIARRVGDQDKLFGSVTAHDIEKALADEGLAVDRRKILLSEPIKALGVYQVPVKLHGELKAEVKVWVVAE